jgi:hypothetical protein
MRPFTTRVHTLSALVLAAVLALDGGNASAAPAHRGGICGGARRVSCAPRDYCRRTGPTRKDETGVCTARPRTCPPLGKPVCGRDGMTYPNACLAAQAGVNLMGRGVCTVE